MNRISRLITYVCLTLALNARALEDERLLDRTSIAKLSDVVAKDDSFWNLSRLTFEDQSADLFYSQLGPLRTGRLLTLFEDRPERFRSQVDSAAKSALSKSFTYSFREAFLASPGMSWLNDRTDSLAVFVRSSIGSGEEEVSIQDASYRSTEEKWWRQLSESGLQYGIRPFRANPYVFLGFGIGNRTSSLLAVDFDVRYYPPSFTKHHIELICSLRPINGYSISVGTLKDLEGGESSRESSPSLTLKFSKNFHLGVLFAGLELKNHQSVFVGITKAL